MRIDISILMLALKSDFMSKTINIRITNVKSEFSKENSVQLSIKFFVVSFLVV